MTKATVDAGICGFTALIEIIRLSPQRVRVAVSSECEMVSKMGEELKDLNWRDVLHQREDCLLYKSFRQHVKHVACPIPIAILKAIEVEVGAALPRDVAIRFETPSSRPAEQTVR